MRGMRLVLWVPVMGMALTLGGSAALADTVELNDGIVHRGKVVADSPGVVGFKTEAGKFLMIKKADIKELQKDPVAPAVPKEKEKEAAAQNSVEKEEPKPQTDWRKEYEKKLERKEMCDFVDTPLRDFARWFGGVAEVSVVVDPLCIDRKVTVNLSRTPIPLKSVLTNVMLATRCATGMFDHAIYIASSKEAIQKIQAVQLHGAKGLPPGVQERFKKPLAVDLVERPLKDAAAFLSSFGLNVFVDPAILEVPVTIKLMGDVPLAEHFVWVARVAGCGVFYQDDVIRFSRETLMVQKEDIVEKEEPGPRAEWRKEYEQKLEKKNTCSFRNTPLRDVARWFGGVAGVNVVVDPQCADRKVTVDLDRAPIPLKSMLANVVRTAQCASGMFDHAIYIASSREALQKLQAVQFQCISRLPLELQERLKRLPAEVHERLKGSRPMNWDHSTLKDVAAWLGWLAGVNVLVDPAVQEVVVFRHGGLHYRYVKPFLQARIPAFVDKPLACSAADAKKILALAKRNKALLTSYSTIRWAKGTQELIAKCAELGGARSGVFGCPSDPTSEYGGIHFYAIHAVETMQQVMGLGVAEVTARQSGKNTVAAVSYGDGRTATLHLLADSKHGFYATAFCKEGVAHPRPRRHRQVRRHWRNHPPAPMRTHAGCFSGRNL